MRLVKRIRDRFWEIVGEEIPGIYESREAAIRAIELTETEKWQVLAVAKVRDSNERVVTYADVMYALAARGGS